MHSLATTTRLVFVHGLLAALAGAVFVVLLARTIVARTWVLDAGTAPDLWWLVAAALVTVYGAAMVPVIAARAEVAAEGQWREQVVTRALQPVAQAEVLPEGEVLAMAMDLPVRRARYRAGYLPPALVSVLTPLVVALVAAVLVDWVVGVVMAVAFPFVAVVVGGFQRLFSASSGDYRRRRGQFAASYLEAIRALGMLRLFDAESVVVRRLAAAAERVRKGVMRVLAVNQLLILVIDLAFGLFVLTGTALVAQWRLRDGAISTGDALAAVLLSLQMLAPISQVGAFFYLGIGGRAAAKEIDRFTALPVPEFGLGRRPADGIHATDLTARADDRIILGPMDFDAPAPGLTVVVGPSGAGKTTLLRALAGLTEADGEGLPTTESIALVEQQPVLFSGTVADNLLLARPDASRDEQWAALRAAGAAEFVEALGAGDAAGLDAVIAESAADLSGGQRQRLALARALLANRPVLLLDEPTAALDPATEAALIDTLQAISADHIIVCVTHRLSIATRADAVVVLDAGNVVEAGTPARLAEQGGYLAGALAQAGGRA